MPYDSCAPGGVNAYECGGGGGDDEGKKEEAEADEVSCGGGDRT